LTIVSRHGIFVGLMTQQGLLLVARVAMDVLTVVVMLHGRQAF
jgi:hypothetical protein